MQFFKSLFLCLIIFSGVASAQTYPDLARPLKLVIINGPGSSIDILGRALAQGIHEVSGMNVVVHNRPGGDGVIAVQALVNSPPDGYTMLLTSNSTQVFNVHQFAKLPYDPIKDMISLEGIASTGLVLNVGPSTSVKNAREFIAEAKKSPGALTFGNSTAATRLAGEMLQRESNIELLSVPYKNVSDAMLGLAAGQLDSIFIDPGSSAAFYKLGVRPIAVTGSTRMKGLPDIPTLQEEGLEKYEIKGWFATYFPSGVKPEIVSSMREILRKASNTNHVKDVLTKYSMEPMPLGGDDLIQYTRTEIERWGPYFSTKK